MSRKSNAADKSSRDADDLWGGNNPDSKENSPSASPPAEALVPLVKPMRLRQSGIKAWKVDAPPANLLEVPLPGHNRSGTVGRVRIRCFAPTQETSEPKPEGESERTTLAQRFGRQLLAFRTKALPPVRGRSRDRNSSSASNSSNSNAHHTYLTARSAERHERSAQKTERPAKAEYNGLAKNITDFFGGRKRPARSFRGTLAQAMATNVRLRSRATKKTGLLTRTMDANVTAVL